MKHTLILLALVVSLYVPVLAEPLAVVTVVTEEQSSYSVARVYGGQLSSRRESQLGFEFPGIVAEVTVDEGDVVNEGDVLLSLDTAAIEAQLRGALADVATARANLTAQRAQLALSKATLDRQEDLAETGHASAQRLDELRMQNRVDAANLLVLQTRLQRAQSAFELAEVNLRKARLTAPYSGIVQSRLVDEGSVISPGQTAMVLVESGSLEARIGIPEAMVETLAPGRSYEFKVNQRAVPGRLKAVLPRVDAATGTVTALFTLDDEHLYAGSLVEMRLTVDVAERGYWVPLTALSEAQRGLWSVLVVEDEVVNSRLVEVLHRGADRVYVRGTLQAGEHVIATGTSRIVPGQAVIIATTQGQSK